MILVCMYGHVHDPMNHLTRHSSVLSTFVFLCACMLDDYDYVCFVCMFVHDRHAVSTEASSQQIPVTEVVDDLSCYVGVGN